MWLPKILNKFWVEIVEIFGSKVKFIVVYLTVYSLLPQGVQSDRIFFQMLGVVALMVAFLNAFFLKEPTGSHDGEHEEAPILVTANADRQYRS